ncbi:hypothetical protein ACFQZE_04130 [Paenibacillus sp. GCM10027627]|uniref:hypothetical protein n=1 Tax=unclassified Paenibacillus TaxID=185978 RepID=UPI003634A608
MNLMELRFPTGFAVCYNRFYDVEPEPEKDDFIANWHYFTQDLLQIHQMKLEEGSWLVPKQRKETLLLDLGWYPDSSTDGEFVLVAVNENWDTLKEKRSRDRFEIKETLEAWMELIYIKEFSMDNKKEQKRMIDE